MKLADSMKYPQLKRLLRLNGRKRRPIAPVASLETVDNDHTLNAESFEDRRGFASYACLVNLADMHRLDIPIETSAFRSELMIAAHDLLGWDFKVERKNSVSDWTTSATFGDRIVGFLYGNNYQALFSGKTPEGSTLSFDHMFSTGFSAFYIGRESVDRYRWVIPRVSSASELRMRASVLGIDRPWLTIHRGSCGI